MKNNEEKAWRTTKQETESVMEERKRHLDWKKTCKIFKKQVCNIKDKQGEKVIRPIKTNERWTEYFNELLNVEEQNDEEEEEIAEQDEADQITKEKLEEVLKNMKNFKFPGSD